MEARIALPGCHHSIPSAQWILFQSFFVLRMASFFASDLEQAKQSR